MLVAIGAEQFPIAAVRRIVVVIAILVVDFQELQIALVERARAASAYPWRQLERLSPIARQPFLGIAAGVADNLI